jgi:hypothetical protein
MLNKTKKTKSLILNLRNGDTRKQAGSNRLQIVVRSEDWRIPSHTVNMTVREAQSLRSFLNDNLTE